MNILPVNNINSNNTNFGHTFKVSICVRNQAGDKYTFINPVNNTKLYKDLNSKFVGWLNEDFITDMRTRLKKPRKLIRQKTARDLEGKKQLTEALTKIDSDYREINMARSVYNDKGLGYVATGIDVPVIENLHGATQIGIAKADALELYGVTRTPYIDTVVREFKNNSIQYAKAEDNLLRSKSGKEVMLRLNFIKTGEKKGNPVYEFENFEFHPIKKSIKQKMLTGDLFMSESPRPQPERSYMDEFRKTVINQINKIIK
jgi:hypothetical protein